MSNEPREEKAAIDQRFEYLRQSLDQRFEARDGRLIDLDKSWNARFSALQRSIDWRLADIEKRNRLDTTFKWICGMYVIIMLGILAIIVKQFLG